MNFHIDSRDSTATGDILFTCKTCITNSPTRAPLECCLLRTNGFGGDSSKIEGMSEEEGGGVGDSLISLYMRSSSGTSRSKRLGDGLQPGKRFVNTMMCKENILVGPSLNQVVF